MFGKGGFAKVADWLGLSLKFFSRSSSPDSASLWYDGAALKWTDGNGNDSVIPTSGQLAIYGDTAALQTVRANLLSTSTTQVNIALVGDSFTEGQGASPVTNSFVDQLRLRMAAAYGDGGRGMLLTNDETTPWSTTGVWSYDGDLPFVSHNLLSTSAVATAQVPVTGDTADIYYVKRTNTAAFGYSVDAGGSVAIGGAGTATPAITKENVSLATNAAHTLHFTTAAGGKETIILGVAPKIGTTGVRLHNVGIGGALASSFSDRTAGAYRADFLPVMDPDLTIIWLGHNDCTSHTTLANYTADIQTIIDKAQQGGGGVLLVGQIDRNTAAYSPSPAEYNEALLNLATLNGCAYLDMSSYFGAYADAVAEGLIDAPTAHPTNAGHALIANVMFGALLPLGWAPTFPIPAASSMSWYGRSKMTSPADGEILLQNAAGSSGGFTSLYLGQAAAGASNLRLRVSANTANFEFADGSNYCNINGLNIAGASIAATSAYSGTVAFYAKTATATGIFLGDNFAVDPAKKIGFAAINGAFGASITTGAGAPAGTPPNGTIYLRSDGGAGSTLYVYEGGSWVPK